MLKISSLKLIVSLIIFCFANGNALAFYKPKVVVTELSDPKNWDKPFSPGKLISRLLEKKLLDRVRFQIIPAGKIGNMNHPEFPDSSILNKPLSEMPKSSKMNKEPMKEMEKQSSMDSLGDEPESRIIKKSHLPFKKYENSKNFQLPTFPPAGSYAKHERPLIMEPAIHYYEDDSEFNVIPIQNPDNEMREESMAISGGAIPWPGQMGNIPEKASLYKIKGQIVKFDPGRTDNSMQISEREEQSGTENAELEIKIQLVQNKTGRIVKKQNFRAFSNSGKRPFSEKVDFSSAEEFNPKPSSMGLALSFVTKEMVAFVNDTISSGYLEGEIISIKNEDVLVNIGRQNGVKVGDRFRVFSLSLNLTDPLTEVDLGDIYVKMGIIRIVETMRGFSKAMIITGEELIPGNLIQSFKKIKNSYNEFSADVPTDDFKEKTPWWEFRGIKSVN